jgi:class 3 adenylate cyclase
MAELPTGTVTLLFADIEGSTQLVYRLGDGYGALLDEYRRLLRGAASAGGGVEIDCRADEFFAAFPLASDALAAAIAAQRAVRAQVWPVDQRDRPAQVRVRIGLHTGEPIVRAGAYLGLDVHVAVRVCAAGHGGQILLSQATRDLVADSAQTRDLGCYELAGVPQPRRLFQVLAPELRVDFPPLRAANAEYRRRVPLPQRRRRAATPAEVGRRIQALLPEVEPDLRSALVELGAALFVADRALTPARELLEAVDQRALARQLEAQRPLAVRSRRAQAHLESLEAQGARLDTLAARIEELGRSAGELPVRLGGLRRAEEVQRLREQIAALTDQLDKAFHEAVRVLDPLNFKRQRTRYHGVFRSGSRYVVPFYDESGRELQRTFESARAARDFHLVVEVADKAQSEQTGPSSVQAVKLGEISGWGSNP